MKVILLENVRKIGSIGEIIDVKRGFARNYLISKKKALFASKENIKEVEKIKQELNKKDQDKKKEAKSILEKRIKVLEEDSGLFVISVLMEEPQLAADIANYISSYIQTYVSSKSTDKAKKNTLFINDRLLEIEKKLKQSEDNLMEFFKSLIRSFGSSSPMCNLTKCSSFFKFRNFLLPCSLDC